MISKFINSFKTIQILTSCFPNDFKTARIIPDDLKPSRCFQKCPNISRSYILWTFRERQLLLGLDARNHLKERLRLGSQTPSLCSACDSFGFCCNLINNEEGEFPDVKELFDLTRGGLFVAFLYCRIFKALPFLLLSSILKKLQEIFVKVCSRADCRP